MNIAILCGGISPEREVSLSSAALIANALEEKGHKVCLCDVYVGLGEDTKITKELFRGDVKYSHKVSETVPDLEAVISENGGRRELIGPHVIDLCKIADAVYLALHGGIGENGQLQAMLDIYGIKYTGSGYIGSLLAMDKDIAKTLMSEAGVPVPPGFVGSTDDPDIKDKILKMGLPCVIKPCSCGSSVGVSIIEKESELDPALEFARKYEKRILIEKKIVGRELTVAILNGRVLPAIEIIPKNGYYDYKNKYQSGLTEEICPAHITEAEANLLADETRRVFEALKLKTYARMDYILAKDGTAYCLESNTLPGMTPTSLVPQAAAAVGISYPDLCDTIIRLSLE